MSWCPGRDSRFPIILLFYQRLLAVTEGVYPNFVPQASEHASDAFVTEVEGDIATCLPRVWQALDSHTAKNCEWPDVAQS
jgi:hypothetical protein